MANEKTTDNIDVKMGNHNDVNRIGHDYNFVLHPNPLPVVIGLDINAGNPDSSGMEITSIGSSGSPSIGAEISVTGRPGQNVIGARVVQNGPGVGLKVVQSGPGVGLRIVVQG